MQGFLALFAMVCSLVDAVQTTQDRQSDPMHIMIRNVITSPLSLTCLLGGVVRQFFIRWSNLKVKGQIVERRLG